MCILRFFVPVYYKLSVTLFLPRMNPAGMQWARPELAEDEINALEESLRESIGLALIIEETDLLSASVPAQFTQKYNNTSGSLLVPLDESIIDHIVQLHVIFPSIAQFYSARHLQSNPHYTIKIGAELNDLIHKATRRQIKVRYYCSNQNYIDGNVVRVINNLHMHTIEKMMGVPRNLFDVKTIVRGMLVMKTKVNEKCGTYTSHVGFSPTLGQHWEHPYPSLDDHVGLSGLCKPGITRSMPMNLRSAMGTCLFGLATIQNGVWPGKPLFGDLRRQQECSAFLADSLGHPQK